MFSYFMLQTKTNRKCFQTLLMVKRSAKNLRSALANDWWLRAISYCFPAKTYSELVENIYWFRTLFRTKWRWT